MQEHERQSVAQETVLFNGFAPQQELDQIRPQSIMSIPGSPHEKLVELSKMI